MFTLNRTGSDAAISRSESEQANGSNASAGLEAGRGDELTQLAALEASALLASERRRAEDTWLRALASMRESFGRLEAECDGVVSALSAEPTDALARMVERVAEAANRTTEAAVQRTRADGEARLQDMQAACAELEHQLHEERLKYRAALDVATRERQAHEEAEARLAGASEAAAALESQLKTARLELDSVRVESASAWRHFARERAECERLMGILHALRKMLEEAGLVSAPDARDDSSVVAEDGSERELATSELPRELTASSARETAAAPAEEPTVRTLVLVPPVSPGAENEPELAEYVRGLLASVESAYAADVAGGSTPATVIRRLTDNLRAARERCLGPEGARFAGASTAFDDQLRVLLNAPAASTFARHLGIATHDLYGGTTPLSWVHARMAG